MEQINEYSKEVVDRYLKSMGYDPQHIDRDKRMAFTKTIRFQQFAQRMGESVVLSKPAQVIKEIFKKKRMVEDLYDHEKDDKDGTTYGKKPKLNSAKEEDNIGDDKTQAAAVLSGGTTLTGQKRDTVSIDPVIKKPKQGTPSSDTGDIKYNKQ